MRCARAREGPRAAEIAREMVLAIVAFGVLPPPVFVSLPSRLLVRVWFIVSFFGDSWRFPARIPFAHLGGAGSGAVGGAIKGESTTFSLETLVDRMWYTILVVKSAPIFILDFESTENSFFFFLFDVNEKQEKNGKKNASHLALK